MRNKRIYCLWLAMWFAFGYYVAKVYGQLSILEICSQGFLLGLLITIAEKNLREAIYEDEITISTMVAGIVVSALVAFQQNSDYLYIIKNIGLSVAGILIGGGSLYLFGLFMDFLYKKESLGGGDVKLVAGLGSFVGPYIIWYLPIWVIVFWVVVKPIKVIGSLRGDSVASSVPTAPLHFISLLILLSIQQSLVNSMNISLWCVIALLSGWVLYRNTDS